MAVCCLLIGTMLSSVYAVVVMLAVVAMHDRTTASVEVCDSGHYEVDCCGEGVSDVERGEDMLAA
jgi:hypothetical protein